MNRKPPESTILQHGSKETTAATVPQTMANILKNTASDTSQELEVTVDQMLGKIKSVYYYISNRLNRKSILEMFRKNFKSLAFENFRFYQSADGIRYTILEIGLFTNSPDYTAELVKLESVTFKNSILRSIPAEDLDEDGKFIPRPERKILVSGLGLHDLAADKLKFGFEGYVEFSSCPKVVLLGNRKNGHFSGEAVINVQNFLALPKRDFDFKISGGGL